MLERVNPIDPGIPRQNVSGTRMNQKADLGLWKCRLENRYNACGEDRIAYVGLTADQDLTWGKP